MVLKANEAKEEGVMYLYFFRPCELVYPVLHSFVIDRLVMPVSLCSTELVGWSVCLAAC